MRARHDVPVSKLYRVEIRDCLRQLRDHAQLKHLIEVTVVKSASPIYTQLIATHLTTIGSSDFSFADRAINPAKRK
jgi:hypothetical protein